LTNVDLVNTLSKIKALEDAQKRLREQKKTLSAKLNPLKGELNEQLRDSTAINYNAKGLRVERVKKSTQRRPAIRDLLTAVEQVLGQDKADELRVQIATFREGKKNTAEQKAIDDEEDASPDLIVKQKTIRKKRTATKRKSPAKKENNPDKIRYAKRKK